MGTTLHGGDRGGKAIFPRFAVSKTKKSPVYGEVSQFILSPIVEYSPNQIQWRKREHVNDINKLCELSNPPKTSLKCIHNSTVNNEAFTMCPTRKFKRKLLNLLTDSREKDVSVVVVVVSAGYGVCKSFFARLAKLFLLKRIFQ